MASFSKDEIWAINEAVVETNTKKATIFGCQFLLVGKKWFSCWICNTIVKMHLTCKIPEMLLNCKQSSYYATFLITKKYIFYSYPTDTANTKTISPSGSVHSTRYIQLFRERLSEKVHATNPKGIVDGFELTVFKEIWKNGRKGRGNMSASAKGKQQK